MTAPVSNLSEQQTEFNQPGSFTYAVPWWADELDIVTLGGGDGGGLTGGEAGAWSVATVGRGSGAWLDVITGVVGDGGRGGYYKQHGVYVPPTPGQQSRVGVFARFVILGLPTQTPGIAGLSARHINYNDFVYLGGEQGDGNAPGGGGVAHLGSHSRGGHGAPGAVWFNAYQRVLRSLACYVGRRAGRGFVKFGEMAPQMSLFDTPGLYNYVVPWWSVAIDVAVLTAGAGGEGGAAPWTARPGVGRGGGAGHWVVYTLIRGRDLDWHQYAIPVVIGEGGLGGLPGATGLNGQATGVEGTHIEGGSGAQTPGVGDVVGKSAGDMTHNGVTYPGGVEQTAPGQPGNEPGGGGAGGLVNGRGGRGAPGAVWLYAYQGLWTTAPYTQVSIPSATIIRIDTPFATALYRARSVPSATAGMGAPATFARYFATSRPSAIVSGVDRSTAQYVGTGLPGASAIWGYPATASYVGVSLPSGTMVERAGSTALYVGVSAPEAATAQATSALYVATAEPSGTMAAWVRPPSVGGLTMYLAISAPLGYTALPDYTVGFARMISLPSADAQLAHRRTARYISNSSYLTFLALYSYDVTGPYEYLIPTACTDVDVIALGAGAGGSAEVVGTGPVGTGGDGGQYVGWTLTRGIDIPWSQRHISCVVGAPGNAGLSSGAAGGPGYASSFSVGPSAAVGAGGRGYLPGEGTQIGKSPGDFDFNGYTYVGGAPSTGWGNPPGGGAGGSTATVGPNYGAAGKVWFHAYIVPEITGDRLATGVYLGRSRPYAGSLNTDPDVSVSRYRGTTAPRGTVFMPATIDGVGEGAIDESVAALTKTLRWSCVNPGVGHNALIVIAGRCIAPVVAGMLGFAVDYAGQPVYEQRRGEQLTTGFLWIGACTLPPLGRQTVTATITAPLGGIGDVTANSFLYVGLTSADTWMEANGISRNQGAMYPPGSRGRRVFNCFASALSLGNYGSAGYTSYLNLNDSGKPANRLWEGHTRSNSGIALVVGDCEDSGLTSNFLATVDDAGPWFSAICVTLRGSGVSNYAAARYTGLSVPSFTAVGYTFRRRWPVYIGQSVPSASPKVYTSGQYGGTSHPLASYSVDPHPGWPGSGAADTTLTSSTTLVWDQPDPGRDPAVLLLATGWCSGAGTQLQITADYGPYRLPNTAQGILQFGAVAGLGFLWIGWVVRADIGDSFPDGPQQVRLAINGAPSAQSISGVVANSFSYEFIGRLYGWFTGNGRGTQPTVRVWPVNAPEGYMIPFAAMGANLSGPSNGWTDFRGTGAAVGQSTRRIDTFIPGIRGSALLLGDAPTRIPPAVDNSFFATVDDAGNPGWVILSGVMMRGGGYHYAQGTYRGTGHASVRAMAMPMPQGPAWAADTTPGSYVKTLRWRHQLPDLNSVLFVFVALRCTGNPSGILWRVDADNQAARFFESVQKLGTQDGVGAVYTAGMTAAQITNRDDFEIVVTLTGGAGSGLIGDVLAASIAYRGIYTTTANNFGGVGGAHNPAQLISAGNLRRVFTVMASGMGGPNRGCTSFDSSSIFPMLDSPTIRHQANTNSLTLMIGDQNHRGMLFLEGTFDDPAPVWAISELGLMGITGSEDATEGLHMRNLVRTKYNTIHRADCPRAGATAVPFPLADSLTDEALANLIATTAHLKMCTTCRPIDPALVEAARLRAQ